MTADHLLHDFADALIAVSPDGKVIFWSRGAEEVFGYQREEMVGRDLVGVLVPRENRDEEQGIFRAALAAGSATYEAVRKRKDGSTIYVDVTMKAIRDAEGAVNHIAISKKDVTQLRCLREGAVVEAKFRGLLDAAPDAMVMVNADGRIVLANSEAERLFGYAREELLGKLVEVLVPERFRRGHAGHRGTFAADPKTRPMGAGLDLAALRKDGKEFPAEISLIPVRTEAGSYTTAAVRNVADRRKIEAKFRGLLEAAPDAIVIVDRTGRIVLVNSQTEKLFGYPRAELIGKPVEVLIPDRFRHQHQAHRDGFFGRPHVRAMDSEMEFFARRRDGAEFPAEISLGPLETEEGVLVFTAVRDVTQRKKTEFALRAANSELEAFSYSVAHDLRAPLRGMSGFAQILLDEYGDKLGADGLDCLLEIRNSALRMSGLIDALLSLSRVTRTEPRPQRIDLAALARATVSRLAAEEPARAVDVVVQDHLWAHVDPDLARTLVDNLVGNAWKFTANAPAARIEVGAEDHEGLRAFFVRDNGAGFDMAHAAKLFVPFQRLHTVGEFPGTGIGLATAQRIVHRHGGRIWAEGKVGEGATVFFTVAAQAPGGKP
jgi:PAS domain S-box-containing protein